MRVKQGFFPAYHFWYAGGVGANAGTDGAAGAAGVVVFEW